MTTFTGVPEDGFKDLAKLGINHVVRLATNGSLIHPPDVHYPPKLRLRAHLLSSISKQMVNIGEKKMPCLPSFIAYSAREFE